ncbi:nicotinic acid phosphoribosyltransferase [Mycoplasmopsis maculosa]|uniref:nicotinate phosphoribosyltransferase n=1 Tax=Mycoplasmopsis maculosa TaxID=114885 RepID=A0A449B411_9BACT|nr:nicotinate phosphoribosyltransferase [Mycoplasmopsis maculosa]VEU75341.1 nicotinic acid phosphoribosyltransferase [Mycoplasmopsis maculosa]
MEKKNLDKYIANYFHDIEKILLKEHPNNVITLQFFQRRDNSILAGMEEVLELLKEYTDTSKYQIKYLKDGSKIQNREVVLELTGNYQYFGKYEGIIDGILSRYSSLATNANDCVIAANGKEVIFMGDRADHYLMQERDGKAVTIGGITSMSTEAQNIIQNDDTFGSVPHIFIQNFDGDTGKAMKAYLDMYPNVKIISLVDYHNNVIEQSLESFKALGKNLYGVRIDTSKNMKDHMFDNEEDKPEYYGVNVEQIKRLRKSLDNAGANHVKIAVSSGFNPSKIAQFETEKAPVDAYGVGQAMFKMVCGFSADATILNGKNQAKEGRGYNHNFKLIEFK